MKIRTGFVSNSSSSNFIVAFSKKPESAEEVKGILFPDGNNRYGCYGDFYSTEQVSETVWKDIQRQKPNDKNKIWDAAHGWLEGDPGSNWEDFEDEDGKMDWKARNKASCEHRQKVIKEFNEQNPDTYIYCFEYADDNGSYFGALEHGGLFNALPHIVISRH
jgi:hypothetical protein